MSVENWLLLFAALAAAVTVAVTVIAFLMNRRSLRLRITEEQRPAQREGLILLVGPVKASSPAAIEYHLPVLHHCWLIGTKESVQTSQMLRGAYPTVVFHWDPTVYLIDPDEITSTYALVSRILDEEVPGAGLQTAKVIADITGGTKPMTAGLTLACIDHKCNMQYMKTPRNEAGQPVHGATPVPIKIDATFKWS